MHRCQYDKLLNEIKIHVGDYGPIDTTIQLFVPNGRHKGKYGTIIFINHGKITIKFDDEQLLTLLYTKLERIDANGKPIFATSLDITGRPVTGNNVVCYSVSTGQSSHALEIGRVIKTNPSGSLSVHPIIRNGERIKNTYRGERVRSSVTADRVIILPVDITLVTTWVLTGFEVYKDAVDIVGET